MFEEWLRFECASLRKKIDNLENSWSQSVVLNYWRKRMANELLLTGRARVPPNIKMLATLIWAQIKLAFENDVDDDGIIFHIYTLNFVYFVFLFQNVLHI